MVEKTLPCVLPVERERQFVMPRVAMVRLITGLPAPDNTDLHTPTATPFSSFVVPLTAWATHKEKESYKQAMVLEQAVMSIQGIMTELEGLLTLPRVS